MKIYKDFSCRINKIDHILVSLFFILVFFTAEKRIRLLIRYKM